MLSTDSVPGSERLLRDSAFSAGDLHPNSVGGTISTLSAMSEDSAAESSGSEPDPALGVSALPGHGHNLRLSQPENVQETFKMIEKPPFLQTELSSLAEHELQWCRMLAKGGSKSSATHKACRYQQHLCSSDQVDTSPSPSKWKVCRLPAASCLQVWLVLP